MKAKVWKDRETGVWCFQTHALYGECRTWEATLLDVLAALYAHRYAHRAVRM